MTVGRRGTVARQTEQEDVFASLAVLRWSKHPRTHHRSRQPNMELPAQLQGRQRCLHEGRVRWRQRRGEVADANPRSRTEAVNREEQLVPAAFETPQLATPLTAEDVRVSVLRDQGHWEEEEQVHSQESVSEEEVEDRQGADVEGARLWRKRPCTQRPLNCCSSSTATTRATPTTSLLGCTNVCNLGIGDLVLLQTLWEGRAGPEAPNRTGRQASHLPRAGKQPAWRCRPAVRFHALLSMAR